MVGRNRIEEKNLLDNKQRLDIIKFVATPPPKSITQIENGLKINRGNLKHHIKLLTEAGIIEKHQQKEVAGKPVVISATPKCLVLLDIKAKENEKYNERVENIMESLKPQLDKEWEQTALKLETKMKVKK